MPMDMRVVLTEFEGILIIEPEYFQDHRGFFFESYSKRRFAEHGLEHAFVQDNHSRSPGASCGASITRTRQPPSSG